MLPSTILWQISTSLRSDLAIDALEMAIYSRNGNDLSELIHRKGPWRNVEHIEWATLNYVDWFNNRRIHESLDYVPPIEFEDHYYDANESESLAVLEMM